MNKDITMKNNMKHKELIEKAESLYGQIKKMLRGIEFSIRNNDRYGMNISRNQMGGIMCDVLQLLGCILERKDNIVDLSEIWKDKTVAFERTELVVVSNFFRTSMVYADKGTTLGEAWDEQKYAYVTDLMPKDMRAPQTIQSKTTIPHQTDPKYRPFRTVKECWDEMHNHPDFGWVLCDGVYLHLLDVYCNATHTNEQHDGIDYDDALEELTFTDGAPFGIKVEG